MLRYLIILLLIFHFLHADDLETKDGSILKGQLLGMHEGNLTIQTSYAGKIKIPYHQIVKINGEEEFSVRLDDNRTFSGPIRSEADSKFRLGDSPDIFTFSEIRHLWKSDSDDPLLAEAQKRAQLLLMKWKHSLGFDLTGASGNTQNFGLGIRLDSSLGNKSRGYDFYLSYNNSTKKNVTIVDETKFGAEYDSRFFEELAWYAKTDLENDRLEEIDLRATAALGLKYLWIDKERYRVSFRGGAATRYEKTGMGKSENAEPALDIGLEYAQIIRDFVAIESDFTYIPNVSEFSDFLLSQDSALIIPLDQKENWKIRSGLTGTYNSTPVIDKEELDLKYYLRLVYQFD